MPAMDDGYGDLEVAAKDFIRRFGITAGDDIENLSHIVGEGATKLQGKFLFICLKEDLANHNYQALSATI
jgi:hypothetical protein